MDIKRYVKTPVEVDAVQVTDENFLDIAVWAKSEGVVLPSHGRSCSVLITTPEGNMLAPEGDWVVKGLRGNIYPVADEIFRETHELVEDG